MDGNEARENSSTAASTISVMESELREELERTQDEKRKLKTKRIDALLEIDEQLNAADDKLDTINKKLQCRAIKGLEDRYKEELKMMAQKDNEISILRVSLAHEAAASRKCSEEMQAVTEKAEALSARVEAMERAAAEADELSRRLADCSRRQLEELKGGFAEERECKDRLWESLKMVAAKADHWQLEADILRTELAKAKEKFLLYTRLSELTHRREQEECRTRDLRGTQSCQTLFAKNSRDLQFAGVQASATFGRVIPQLDGNAAEPNVEPDACCEADINSNIQTDPNHPVNTIAAWGERESDATDGDDVADVATTMDEPPAAADAHTSVLRVLYDDLVSKIFTQSVAVKMFQCNALTPAELESIQSDRDRPTQATRTLLNFLLRQPVEVYDSFLDALKQSRQMDVYEWLVTKGYNECPLSSVKHANLVREHYIFLLENVETKFSGLLQQLWTDDVLDRAEREDIAAEKSSTRRNEKLFSALSRKSAEQFETFLAALDKTGQSHVRNEITGCGPRSLTLQDAISSIADLPRAVSTLDLQQQQQQQQQQLGGSRQQLAFDLEDWATVLIGNVDDPRQLERCRQGEEFLESVQINDVQEQLRLAKQTEVELRRLLGDREEKLAAAAERETQFLRQIEGSAGVECAGGSESRTQSVSSCYSQQQNGYHTQTATGGRHNRQPLQMPDDITGSHQQQQLLQSELVCSPSAYSSNEREIKFERVTHKLPGADDVMGVTLLDNELYVLRQTFKDQVDVYGPSDYCLRRRLNVRGLNTDGSGDMASCGHHGCLYVSDYFNKCIHRIAMNESPSKTAGGSKATKSKVSRARKTSTASESAESTNRQGPAAVPIFTTWPVGDRASGLSVTAADRSLLVTCPDAFKLKQFTTDGRPLRDVGLNEELVQAWHAIQLGCSGDQFVVCHGWRSRVCIVRSSGRLVQAYCAPVPPGSPPIAGGQLSGPCHVAVDGDGSVFVADRGSNRVFALDPALNYVGDVGRRDLPGPSRLHLDVVNRRLYVGQWDAQLTVVELTPLS